MRYDVTGSFHGIDGGVPRGVVVDIEDLHAQRYIDAEAADRADEEPHFPDKQWVKELEEEDAVVEPEKVETAVVKRRGRPKKQPDWHDEHAPGWKDTPDT
jgi:hypothetical protein